MKWIMYFLTVIIGIILKDLMIKNNPGIDTYGFGFIVGVIGGYFLYGLDRK